MKFRIGPFTFGVIHDVVWTEGSPYLERWMVRLGPLGSIRLHKFHRGDDDRALHDHPWWFITIPLQGYIEEISESNEVRCRRYVAPLRPHFRRALHRHIVVLRRFPTWTIVITGCKRRDWGFWPQPDRFIPWREWV